MQEIIHIDLFSGANIFHECLLQAGIAVTHHYYSEIDIHAIATSRYHYHTTAKSQKPKAKGQKTHTTNHDTRHQYIGSVEHVDGHQIRSRHPHGFIIVTFGFPCQDISIAGAGAGIQHPERMPTDLAQSMSESRYRKLWHQLNGDMGQQTDTTRSGLLFEAARIVRELQADCFLAENVKNLFSVNEGTDIMETTRLLSLFDMGMPQYHTEMQLVNTLWFLPQNRERLFFVGYPRTRSFRNVLPIGKAADQPVSKSGVDMLYWENSKTKWVDKQRTDIPALKTSSELVRQPLIKIGNLSKKGQSQKGQIFSDKGASPSLSAGTHGYVNGYVALTRIRTEEGKAERRHNRKTGIGDTNSFQSSEIALRNDDHVSGLTTSQSEPEKHIAILTHSKDASGRVTHYNENDHAGTIKGPTGNQQQYLKESPFTKGGGRRPGDSLRIRKLTEIECERLQGWQDDWTAYGHYPDIKSLQSAVRSGEIDKDSKSYYDELVRLVNEPIPNAQKPKAISATQRYKIIGNGISIPPVTAICQRIKSQLIEQVANT